MRVLNLTPNSWNKESTKSRYESYLKKYRDAKTAQTRAGFGLIDAEIPKGMTTTDKLNNLCRYFHDLDELFGIGKYVPVLNAPAANLQKNCVHL